MTNDKTPPISPDATPEEVKTFRDAQAEEWGTYVAADNITVGGTLAYLAGDPVPVSNVKRHGYEAANLVVKTNTAAAAKLAARLHEAATADNVTTDLGEPVRLNVQVK